MIHIFEGLDIITDSTAYIVYVIQKFNIFERGKFRYKLCLNELL